MSCFETNGAWIRQNGTQEGTFPAFQFIPSGRPARVFGQRYLYLISLLLFSLTTGCGRQSHQSFDGERVLNVDAVMLEVQSKLKDKVDPRTLTELRAKLQHERPRLFIHDGKIRIQIETASMELTHAVKEKVGSCMLVLVGGSTEVKYCLMGNDILKQEKVNKSTNDIAEIYRRIH